DFSPSLSGSDTYPMLSSPSSLWTAVKNSFPTFRVGSTSTLTTYCVFVLNYAKPANHIGLLDINGNMNYRSAPGTSAAHTDPLITALIYY
ncbi:MAG: hypothetical protein LBH19_13070, partial [Dysgonamonadaceae bacterium]|nr:hypothetical protein [Dysgonamonadaceae bacterium]